MPPSTLIPGRRVRHLKRPRVGDVIEGATGLELVERIQDYGLRLIVTDTTGRAFERERAATGCWSVLQERTR